MSFKIFPFSAGIPWEIKKGILIPKIPFKVLNNAIGDKNIIVSCYGGLIESYLTLSYLEAFNKIWPSKSLTWCGNSSFLELVQFNGLAKFSQEIPKNILNNYPSPVFFDRLNNAIFNSLNNYIKIKPYYGGKYYASSVSYLKQIWQNSLLDWNNFSIPVFRNDLKDAKFDTQLLLSKFDFNKPYILIIPDKLGLSIHSDECLEWNAQQVKSFSTIASQLGYSVVILSNAPHKYYTNNLPFVFEFSFYSLFKFLKKSKLVLSKEIDFLLISQLISDNYLVSNKVKKYLSFDKVNYLLNKSNKSQTFRSINQSQVIDILKKI